MEFELPGWASIMDILTNLPLARYLYLLLLIYLLLLLRRSCDVGVFSATVQLVIGLKRGSRFFSH